MEGEFHELEIAGAGTTTELFAAVRVEGGERRRVLYDPTHPGVACEITDPIQEGARELLTSTGYILELPRGLGRSDFRYFDSACQLVSETSIGPGDLDVHVFGDALWVRNDEAQTYRVFSWLLGEHLIAVEKVEESWDCPELLLRHGDSLSFFAEGEFAQPPELLDLSFGEGPVRVVQDSYYLTSYMIERGNAVAEMSGGHLRLLESSDACEAHIDAGNTSYRFPCEGGETVMLPGSWGRRKISGNSELPVALLGLGELGNIRQMRVEEHKPTATSFVMVTTGPPGEVYGELYAGVIPRVDEESLPDEGERLELHVTFKKLGDDFRFLGHTLGQKKGEVSAGQIAESEDYWGFDFPDRAFDELPPFVRVLESVTQVGGFSTPEVFLEGKLGSSYAELVWEEPWGTPEVVRRLPGAQKHISTEDRYRQWALYAEGPTQAKSGIYLLGVDPHSQGAPIAPKRDWLHWEGPAIPLAKPPVAVRRILDPMAVLVLEEAPGALLIHYPNLFTLTLEEDVLGFQLVDDPETSDWGPQGLLYTRAGAEPGLYYRPIGRRIWQKEDYVTHNCGGWLTL